MKSSNLESKRTVLPQPEKILDEKAKPVESKVKDTPTAPQSEISKKLEEVTKETQRLSIDPKEDKTLENQPAEIKETKSKVMPSMIDKPLVEEAKETENKKRSHDEISPSSDKPKEIESPNSKRLKVDEMKVIPIDQIKQPEVEQKEPEILTQKKEPFIKASEITIATAEIKDISKEAPQVVDKGSDPSFSPIQDVPDVKEPEAKKDAISSTTELEKAYINDVNKDSNQKDDSKKLPASTV